MGVTVGISVTRSSTVLRINRKEVGVIEILRKTFPNVKFEYKDASHDIYVSNKAGSHICIIFGKDVLIASGKLNGLTAFEVAERLVRIIDKVKDWYVGLSSETKIELRIFE